MTFILFTKQHNVTSATYERVIESEKIENVCENVYKGAQFRKFR